MLNGKNILLGITGGIAAYKIPELVRFLKKAGANVKIIVTPAAKDFVTPLTLSTISNQPVYSEFSDKSTGEWNNHVELALWADLLIIAPATANTIAKMATGVCDNLLLSVYLSSKCPIYIAPAMDLDMYKHPSTNKNIETLISYGVNIIDAKEGELASGLIGKGRMEEPLAIYNTIHSHFNSFSPLSGKNILITAGPTYEQIDPVRFIGNHSSGKMGLELAIKATQLGANVNLVIGPNNLSIPLGINTIHVKSAEEMYNAVFEHNNKADIIIMSAAVSDYTPAKTSNSKIKKKSNSLNIELIPTKDILKSVGEKKNAKQILVGFALETDNEKENALKKLKSKKLDLIILNSLNDNGAGFAYDTNKISIIDKNNNIENYELKSKSEVAADIFHKIISLLN